MIKAWALLPSFEESTDLALLLWLCDDSALDMCFQVTSFRKGNDDSIWKRFLECEYIQLRDITFLF